MDVWKDAWIQKVAAFSGFLSGNACRVVEVVAEPQTELNLRETLTLKP